MNVHPELVTIDVYSTPTFSDVSIHVTLPDFSLPKNQQESVRRRVAEALTGILQEPSRGCEPLPHDSHPTLTTSFSEATGTYRVPAPAQHQERITHD